MRAVPARCAAVLFLLAHGCGAAQSPRPPAPDGFGELAAALRAGGADVTVGRASTRAPFMPVPARVLKVNGANLLVFDLPTEELARQQASRIAPDASRVGTNDVAWMAPPHFYRAGRSIVLYVGEDGRVLALLDRVLGPPIARGAARPVERSQPTDDWVPTTRA
jgi:hypothetical protein